MKQLKDALLKAGVISKEYAKPSIPKKSVDPQKEFKKYHQHQIRTVCELCEKDKPDVEYYKHNNRLIVKRWLCVDCADENHIDDILRETHQSTNARSKTFRRMWGRTKRF